MTYEEVMEYLRNKYKDSPCLEQIMEYAKEHLYERMMYQQQEVEGGVLLRSIIEDVERGGFSLLKIQENPESRETTITAVKKDYNPNYEVRYGFQQHVGEYIFTKAQTVRLDEHGQWIYKSRYTDEHKYYDGELKTVDDLIEAIKKTTPTYDSRGIIVQGPESAYQPFTDEQERITPRIIFQHGRSPIEGEYSELRAIVDREDGRRTDSFRILQENHGRLYSVGKGWFGKIRETSKIIEEELLDKYITGDRSVDVDALLKALREKVHDPSGEIE